CRIGPGRHPIPELLRNLGVRSVIGPDPDRPAGYDRRGARTLHVAAGEIGYPLTRKDRTGAVRLREERGAAAGDGDPNLATSGLAGRGGAEREIAAAELEFVAAAGRRGKAASRHQREKCGTKKNGGFAEAAGGRGRGPKDVAGGVAGHVR